MSDHMNRRQWVLQFIYDGERAWRTPDEIVEGSGGSREETLDLLAEMHVEGWLEVWERSSGPLVTLSSRAARALGAHLISPERGTEWRWGAGTGSGPGRSGGKPRAGGSRGLTAMVADPIDGERTEAGVNSPGRVAPTLLVGAGLCPWPGPAEVEDGRPCPACGGTALGPNSYCLRCDRWGGEGREPGGEPHGPARRSQPPKPAG